MAMIDGAASDDSSAESSPDDRSLIRCAGMYASDTISAVYDASGR